MNDSHIDVILYYLRKKAKYNVGNSFKYTTVDCVFKSKIALLLDKYVDLERVESCDDEERLIGDYINGYKVYWVLAVVSLNDKCIDVYDSYRAAGHDATIKFEIQKFSQLIPLYLIMYGFYTKEGIEAPFDESDFFDVIFMKDIPQQESGSKDCGIFMLAFAEYLSYGQGIPVDSFDSQYLRTRYATLLWN
ncbi:uncharacterized protein LOC129894279 [Solanum dulcamara]|uniref:uncharacterized protein LOC129894279 n=1 Tax=Solanum dulcamara TaxID=45834 RepID=UPI0024857F1E|nr:uncharacterized protein LOC129894279 [Solanum dulcamara]XP_055825867.1 uncharacterized protein LOC129894279 [Solanum dulcamara]XP_055825868.1 uncharacterized protein LOC129894279 [Solanum dulcamara]